MAGQTYPAREQIVIDGGSTDGTLALLQAHRHQLAVLVSEPDECIDDAVNKGLARASGDVVGLLHADDLYADSAVLARIAAAFADPTVEAVYGDLVSIARQDTSRMIRYWRAGDDAPARWRRGWTPPHPTSPRMEHPPQGIPQGQTTFSPAPSLLPGSRNPAQGKQPCSRHWASASAGNCLLRLPGTGSRLPGREDESRRRFRLPLPPFQLLDVPSVSFQTRHLFLLRRCRA